MSVVLDRRVVRLAGGATAVTLVGGGLVVGGGAAQAATFTATDEASLNQAISDANAAAGADTITISATTITLTADITTISDDLTIIDGADLHRGFYAYNATGTFSLTVQDMTIQNTYYSHYGAAIAAFGVSLTVSDVTFDSNGVDGYGGAIGFKDTGYSGLSLTITGSTFENNFSGYDGGAVFANTNATTVSISDSSFTDNYAGTSYYGYGNGGAIAIRDNKYATSVSIVDSTFESNSAYVGGAVYLNLYYSTSASATIERSSFVQNEARNDGGGAVLFTGPGTLDIIDSTFDGNTALNSGAYGGAVYAYGASATIEGSDFTNNQSYASGGAIEAYSMKSLTIRDSSFDGNSSLYSDGGAIYFSYLNSDTTFLIENSTFSNNEAAGVGGAIRANAAGTDVVIDQSTFTGNIADYAGAMLIGGGYSTLEIRNSTISGNEARVSVGGLYNSGYQASLVVVNSIIAGNIDVATGPAVVAADLSAPASSEVDDLVVFHSGTSSAIAVDHSIIGIASIDPAAAGSGNIESTDPVLGALADNGGGTLTMLPADDSPAVDAGDSAVASFDTDQRGGTRVQGDAIDIGAVELQPEQETTTTTTTVPVTTVPVTTVPVTPAPTTVPAVLPPTGGGERTGLLAALLTGVGAVLTFGASRRRRPN